MLIDVTWLTSFYPSKNVSFKDTIHISIKIPYLTPVCLSKVCYKSVKISSTMLAYKTRGTFWQVPTRRIRLSFVECVYPDLRGLLHNFRGLQWIFQ